MRPSRPKHCETPEAVRHQESNATTSSRLELKFERCGATVTSIVPREVISPISLTVASKTQNDMLNDMSDGKLTTAVEYGPVVQRM